MNYKDKVRQHLQTPYGKEMVRIWGLQYVKKELYQAKLNAEGDNRKTIDFTQINPMDLAFTMEQLDQLGIRPRGNQN